MSRRDLRRGGKFQLSLLSRTLNSASFFAPLTSSLILSKGTGVATFTRATTATVVDFEGNVRLCKSGEARFSGARRNQQLLSSSDVLATQSVTVLAGTYNISFTGTGTITLSGAASGTIIGAGARRVQLIITTTAASLTLTVSGSVLMAMLLNVTGQSVLTVQDNDYVSSTDNSTGALGVKYFTTMPDGVTPINSANSKFAYNCLATGDNFSTPDAPANRITGNITLVAWVAPTSWTPTAVQTVVSKDSVSAGGRSYALNIQPTTGNLRLNISLDGTNILSYTSTVSTGFAAGTKHAIAVERDATTGAVRFYTSEDKLIWLQLGATVAGTAGAIFAGNAPVQFGNLGTTGLLFDGRMYDSEIYSELFCSGSGAVLACDFDPSNWTSGTTWTSIDSGEVWSINGNAEVYQGEWDTQGPKGYLAEGATTNLFLNSAVGATQTTPALTAAAYTLSFKGTGSIVSTGGFVGTLAGTGATNRVSLTVSATAAAATLTVTGSVTEVQLELGGFATSYIPTAGTAVIRNADILTYPSAGNILAAQGAGYFECQVIDTSLTATRYPIVDISNGKGFSFTNPTSVSNNTSATVTTKTGLLSVNTGIRKRAGYYGTSVGVTGDGQAPVTNTAGTGISWSVISIGGASGSGALNGNIRNVRLWTSQLTSAQIQKVTA